MSESTGASPLTARGDDGAASRQIDTIARLIAAYGVVIGGSR